MSKLFKQKLFLQIVIPSLVATFFVVAVVWGTTTIGSNITTDGTITLSNGEYIDNATDGSISLMGIASTTSIYFGTNGESIDNRNNGYISLMGIASTTSIYFGTNGETIDNAVNGFINLNGNASTTALFFQKGEWIDNATDGVISLMGVASSTSISLTNLETISNSTNGTIVLGESGGASISFTPASGVITPSGGTIQIGGAFNVSGYATTTNTGVFLPRTHTSAPTCDATVFGGLIVNATSKQLCFCDGSAWRLATSTAGASCF